MKGIKLQKLSEKEVLTVFYRIASNLLQWPLPPNPIRLGHACIRFSVGEYINVFFRFSFRTRIYIVCKFDIWLFGVSACAQPTLVTTG